MRGKERMNTPGSVGTEVHAAWRYFRHSRGMPEVSQSIYRANRGLSPRKALSFFTFNPLFGRVKRAVINRVGIIRTALKSPLYTHEGFLVPSYKQPRVITHKEWSFSVPTKSCQRRTSSRHCKIYCYSCRHC